MICILVVHIDDKSGHVLKPNHDPHIPLLSVIVAHLKSILLSFLCRVIKHYFTFSELYEKELFSQKEIDNLFKTLVLPIFTYGLAVYGASDSDLNVIQRFLDRCHKRHFTSQTVSIFNLLEQQDKPAFKSAINNHMLGAIIPNKKELVYNLRRKRCHLPQIKTERYKKTFVNRFIFEYNLV